MTWVCDLCQTNVVLLNNATPARVNLAIKAISSSFIVWYAV